MNTLLIRGLRQSHDHGGEDWRELMTSAIRGEWPTPKASERTQEAERGLGIGGKPYYFYVLRAEENFGLVVFVLSQGEKADWPSGERGATPFDSGGLWWKKVVTSPELDDTGRRTFFRGHDVPLVDWRTAFENYVRDHYGTVADYLDGSAPGPGSEPQDSEVTIIRGSPNDKQAWTWEVRIPHDLAAGRLELRAAYMTETRRDNYLDWLWRSSPLAENESLRIHQWIEAHVIAPKQYESVAQAVEDWLASEITDG